MLSKKECGNSLLHVSVADSMGATVFRAVPFSRLLNGKLFENLAVGYMATHELGGYELGLRSEKGQTWSRGLGDRHECREAP